jgi:hypothetical protein
MFMKTLDEAELKSLIAELQNRKHIVIENQLVEYGRTISPTEPAGLANGA